MAQDTALQVIELQQLPIIVERLHSVKAEIEQRTAEALSLVCTEQTYKSVKDARAQLTKEFKEYEAQRIAVKDKILEPYNAFEQVYRECVTVPFQQADAELKQKIADVTLDDIQLALVPVSKKSASVYKSVVILYKSIFRAAMESRIIDHNPTIYLTTKGGGVPQEDRQALTDEQVERLLDAIRDLPPYVFVMIGLYAGLRREEILALQWDSVYLDTDTPYLTVRRAWHTEHNRPVISDELKTKAAERNIPLPVCLAECLKAAKETSTSEYVVSNRDGEPLSYTQFKRLWQYIVTRTVKERSYYRYEDGKRVKHTVTPVLGEKAAHNGKVVYSLDFEVTPHQLRHTYITNLIHASVDPKTVQYLAGHESSKITMDIYAKVKYNRPDELVRSMNCAFASWDAAQ